MSSIRHQGTIAHHEDLFSKWLIRRIAQSSFWLCLLCLNVSPLAAEDSVHFWISSSNIATTGPPNNQSQIEAIDSVSGTTRYPEHLGPAVDH